MPSAARLGAGEECEREWVAPDCLVEGDHLRDACGESIGVVFGQFGEAAGPGQYAPDLSLMSGRVRRQPLYPPRATNGPRADLLLLLDERLPVTAARPLEERGAQLKQPRYPGVWNAADMHLEVRVRQTRATRAEEVHADHVVDERRFARARPTDQLARYSDGVRQRLGRDLRREEHVAEGIDYGDRVEDGLGKEVRHGDRHADAQLPLFDEVGRKPRPLLRDAAERAILACLLLEFAEQLDVCGAEKERLRLLTERGVDRGHGGRERIRPMLDHLLGSVSRRVDQARLFDYRCELDHAGPLSPQRRLPVNSSPHFPARAEQDATDALSIRPANRIRCASCCVTVDRKSTRLNS